MAETLVTLPTLVRGDTFEYSFTLGNNWLGALFTDMWFTVRKQPAPPGLISDSTANGVVAQGKVSSGEITFNLANDKLGTVTFADTVTKKWPEGRLYFDLQGREVASPNRLFTISRGWLPVSWQVTASS